MLARHSHTTEALYGSAMIQTRDKWLQRAVAARERIDVAILREELPKLIWFNGLGKRDQELIVERVSSVLCAAVATHESVSRTDSFEEARRNFGDLATVLQGLRIVRSRISLEEKARAILGLAAGKPGDASGEVEENGHQFWLTFDGQVANAIEATDRAAKAISKLPTRAASYPGLDDFVVGLANLRVSGSENKASFVEFVQTVLGSVQSLPLPSPEQIEQSVRRLERISHEGSSSRGAIPSTVRK
jgi:hypothetical protein